MISIEHRRGNLPIDPANVPEYVPARRAPADRGGINIDGPEREAEPRAYPSDLPIVTLDPNKQKICAIGAGEQQQQSLVNESARRQAFDPSIEHRTIEALPDLSRHHHAGDTGHVSI